MIYFLLYLFFILVKNNNKTQAKKSLKKTNILTYIHFSNTNFINGKIIKRKKLYNSFQKDDNDLAINGNEREHVLTSSSDALGNKLEKRTSSDKVKVTRGIGTNFGYENAENYVINSEQVIIDRSEEVGDEHVRKMNRKKSIIIEEGKKKRKKKKSYEKVENLISCSDNIKDIKKDVKLFFFKKRIIYLTEEINKKTTDELISQLLYLDNINNNDIKIYINSPGGSINEGLAILDIFNYIKSDIQTISFGLVASMASVILASGKKGKRKSLPNCRIMIHQPLGNAFGHPHDIEIQTKEILYLKKLLYSYLSKFTDQTIETIEKHSERDYYMNALEAKNYGIVDEVIETKLPHPYFSEISKEKE
ncbi:ATP-dependent Clp protease proteolytic subunit, putative [Plasmodium malariae]|uniref:ATP-dependent Clp protease proteolytic subunit n=1 Tax=Plasmodium malariae TaxID=5858 RepID=A0A1C3KYR4_PLAMA|nr:ATP-dependent Clp protease proteolytic subunit, putative [Plasmodium malariae]